MNHFTPAAPQMLPVTYASSWTALRSSVCWAKTAAASNFGSYCANKRSIPRMRLKRQRFKRLSKPASLRANSKLSVSIAKSLSEHQRPKLKRSLPPSEKIFRRSMQLFSKTTAKVSYRRNWFRKSQPLRAQPARSSLRTPIPVIWSSGAA